MVSIQVPVARLPGFVSQTAIIYRPAFDANIPDADRYMVHCAECGASYSPEIYRIHGWKRTISRVKPCPVCGTARHNGFRCGSQAMRVSHETAELISAGLL